jgi:hypothetical protein
LPAVAGKILVVPDPDRTAYLPPRAARARKLILRRRLGLGWVLAPALFGVVILVAGGLLLAGGGRPGAPWVRVAPLAGLDAGGVTSVSAPGNRVVVVDLRGGGVRAFEATPGPSRCPIGASGSGFARPCTHERWTAAGAPAGKATAPLRQVPTMLAKGDLYVDLR